MSQKVLITAALPYANGPLHFGHIAGAYLPADCCARFHRLIGDEVLYICGSDEHGVAITLSADLAGRTPQEQVDLFHGINQKIFKSLQISFDHYSRTTWPGHIPTTQEFFFDLQKKGFVEKKTVNHLYSEEDQKFLADRYVVGTCPHCGFENARGDECPRCAASYEAIDLKNPRSKITNAPLVLRPSEHLYLRFDLFKEQLKTWISGKNWKDNVLNFANHYIDELKPRAITRDSDWGVAVPGFPSKVFYVWFDAPIGYISATKEWALQTSNPDAWKDYWLNPECRLIQFIGKDNIPFHAVFFPAMLMGQDLPYKLPDDIPANEFFLLEGRQFSKSDGWFIDLEEFFSLYTPDQIRYVLAANAPETSDAEFTWKDFQQRCNGELLGKFGNFVNRVLTFTKTRFDSSIPALGAIDEIDQKFIGEMHLLENQIFQAYSAFHLRKASQLIMELAQLGNVYFDFKKPWSLIKDPHRLQEANTVIHLSLKCVRNLALVSSPIIPESAQKIWHMLGFSSELASERWKQVLQSSFPISQKIANPELLFRKIEDEEIETQISKLGAKKA